MMNTCDCVGMYINGGLMKKVITYGTFDLFHQGHYNLLKRAKDLGDYLIVGVTTEHFDEARGKVNVIDSIMERIENVRKTGFADMIIVEDHDGQKIEDIQKYGVDIFTLGSDWEGAFDYLKQFCEVVYLDRTPNVSSTILRSDRYNIVRLGVVGSGRIVPRFISESKYVSGISVESIYNPVETNFDRYTKKYELRCLNGSYEEFLRYMDAVYIASPNETHYEYAKKALEAGKHVLSEKPLAFTMKESRELYDIASANDVVLMEAIKAAYCPGFAQLINVAKSGRIGDIVDVEANFTRLAADNSRERTDAEYGGAFLEFGPSVLLPVVKLLGREYRDIHIDTLTDERGVDIYTKVNIRYDRAMATLRTGVAVKTEGQLVVSGTAGYIISPSPWWLMRQFDVRYEDSGKVEHYEPTFQGDGLRYEIGEFVSKINGIGSKDYLLTAGESIAMAAVIEKFMETRRNSKK